MSDTERNFLLTKSQLQSLLRSAAEGREIPYVTADAACFHVINNLTPGTLVRSADSGDTYLLLKPRPRDFACGCVFAVRVGWGGDDRRPLPGFVTIKALRFLPSSSSPMEILGTISGLPDSVDLS